MYSARRAKTYITVGVVKLRNGAFDFEHVTTSSAGDGAFEGDIVGTGVAGKSCSNVRSGPIPFEGHSERARVAHVRLQ